MHALGFDVICGTHFLSRHGAAAFLLLQAVSCKAAAVACSWTPQNCGAQPAARLPQLSNRCQLAFLNYSTNFAQQGARQLVPVIQTRLKGLLEDFYLEQKLEVADVLQLLSRAHEGVYMQNCLPSALHEDPSMLQTTQPQVICCSRIAWHACSSCRSACL